MELMTETLEKPLDSNYFEELVDKMVLDEIPGINQEFINVINGLPRSQKRMAILSILDKDLNLFRRIKALTDQNINKMEHIKDIILMLREYVKVGDVEKKKFGEVMTPLELVKEMLSTLPEEVWSNPDLKWLDPANGTGPFPLMVIYKLMIGLKDWEPDDEKRYKHIVENMIYVCEIQPKNMFLYMCAVDPFDKYNLNIYTGSFLEEGFDKHMREVWGIDGFNLTIGNPPYNENNSNNDEKIYFKFIKKSYSNLIYNGFLCYVLPDDSVSYIVRSEKYQIDYINSDNIVNKYFKGIGTKIIYFLSRKINKYTKTKFFDGLCNDEIDVDKFPVILMNLSDSYIVSKIYSHPNPKMTWRNAKYNKYNYRIRFNKIAKVKFSLRGINLVCIDNKLIKKHNLSHEKFDTEVYKYKVVDHSSDRIEFLADNNFDNQKKRVCINTMGEMKPIYDNDGTYLLTDGFVYIDVKNDLEASNLIYLLNSNLSKYLQKVITHNTKNKFKIISFLPCLDLTKKFTDLDLYNEFNLSENEMKIIENTIKN
jgi:site-specific DNA-methyltransferase (adenine-specific)